MKIFLKDFWLYSQVEICREDCSNCGSGGGVIIRKRDINKLIRILKKLNYKGIPKRNKYNDKEYIIFDSDKSTGGQK